MNSPCASLCLPSFPLRGSLDKRFNRKEASLRHFEIVALTEGKTAWVGRQVALWIGHPLNPASTIGLSSYTIEHPSPPQWMVGEWLKKSEGKDLITARLPKLESKDAQACSDLVPSEFVCEWLVPPSSLGLEKYNGVWKFMPTYSTLDT